MDKLGSHGLTMETYLIELFAPQHEPHNNLEGTLVSEAVVCTIGLSFFCVR